MSDKKTSRKLRIRRERLERKADRMEQERREAILRVVMRRAEFVLYLDDLLGKGRLDDE